MEGQRTGGNLTHLITKAANIGGWEDKYNAHDTDNVRSKYKGNVLAITYDEKD